MRIGLGTGTGLAPLARLAIVLALAGGAKASIAEPSVRVLLGDARAQVDIESPPGASRERFRIRDGRLLRRGRELGARVRIESPGSLLVDGREYPGDLELVAAGDRILVVNEIGLERYVAGTVAGEVPLAWPREALRAQAVAARTYALHERSRARRSSRRAGTEYDLRSDARSQNYLGAQGDQEAALAAAAATRGEVLLWQDEPILAVYHSASGGLTAASGEVWGRELPYLVSVEVEGEEDSPDTYWRTPLERATLRRSLAGLGLELGRDVDARVVERSPSGRVRWVEFEGSRGSGRIEARRLRSLLGASRVRSTMFEIRRSGQGLVLVGSGRGHGVGMSQWGARAMAESGSSYREILARFYPGAALGRWSQPSAGRGRR